MDSIFLILFLFTPLLIIIGLVKPSLFNRFFKQKLSRLKLFFALFGLGIIFLLLFALTTDTPSNTSNVQSVEQKQNVPVSSSEILPTPSSKQSPEVSAVKDEITSKPSATLTPTSTPVKIWTPTPKSTTTTYYTPAPTYVPIVPSYICNCSKTCTQISSCQEAYYQLNNCGCSIRDGDKDGVPCENICPGG